MQDNNKHPLYLSSLYLIKFMTWRLKILSTTFNEWEKQREKIIPDLIVETHLGARRNVVSWHNFFFSREEDRNEMTCNQFVSVALGLQPECLGSLQGVQFDTFISWNPAFLSPHLVVDEPLIQKTETGYMSEQFSSEEKCQARQKLSIAYRSGNLV